MGWYPGKLIDRLRSRTRSQEEVRIIPFTPSDEEELEFLLATVVDDLEEAEHAVRGAVHELREIGQVSGKLERLNEKVGGKYTRVIGLWSDMEQIYNNLSNIAEKISSIRNEIDRATRYKILK
jgi:hypothetical protein